ncbi:MAG: hypothetical protein V4501_05280 [Pseudomonadota bacterium]
MLWSRVGLSSLVICSLFAFTGAANAHEDDMNYDNYSYTNGVYIAPVPASPMVRYGYGYRHGYHHYMHHASRHHHGCYAHNGHMYRGYYVCKKYVYEITPMHRDASCSDWKFEWLPASRWHHSAYKSMS